MESKPRFARLRDQLPLIGLISAVIFFANLLWGGSLFGALWVVDGAVLAILISSFAIMAGLTVLKSLFLVAAELSLLVFLSQSYCLTDAAKRSLSSDNALKVLLAVGFLYVGVTFVRSLYEALKGNYEIIKGQGRWKEMIAVCLYFIFIVSFLWEVWLVLWPIVAGLCVFI